jgi:cell division protease FtsH
MGLLQKIWSFLKKPIVYRSAIIAACIYILMKSRNEESYEVKVSSFLSALKEGDVSEILDYGEHLQFRLKDGTWAYTDASVLNKTDVLNLAVEKGADFSREYSMFSLLSQLPISSMGLFLMMYYWNNHSDSSPHKELKHDTRITFADIGGNVKAKEALSEIIDYFKNPQRYLKVGANLPRGVLLYGPPGTGKTMLAKAVANEAGVNFIQTIGSEFIQMYVGVGPMRIRNLFEKARKNKPCIIFIDEIDSLGMKRSSSSEPSSTEYISTLDTLLAEMDGFTPSDEIVVIGATNRHITLDEALLRSNRFDRKIQVGLPDYATRLEILNLNLRNVRDN